MAISVGQRMRRIATRIGKYPNTTVFVISLIVLLLRSRSSIDRIPADPSYWYILDGHNRGLFSLTIGDPYFHVVARLLALVTSWFPLMWQAVVLATLVHCVWAACAATISSVIRLETTSRWLGYLAGFLLVTAPHAAESSLGNVGNVKWPLLAAALLLCCSPKVIQTRATYIALFVVLAGLTQPLTVLSLIPLGLLLVRRTVALRSSLKIILAVLGTLIIQVIKVGVVAATSGQSARVTRPWTGMGLFWWSGLVGPVALAVLAVSFMFVMGTKRTEVTDLLLMLGTLAVATSVASYIMGGIGDRYFVVPMTLAVITASLVASFMRSWNRRLGRVLASAAFIVLLVPTVKWFSASWYLTSGPTWSSEVRRAELLCADSERQTVELSVSPSGTNELDCEYVRRG